jgi:hypothetical protein
MGLHKHVTYLKTQAGVVFEWTKTSVVNEAGGDPNPPNWARPST